MVFVSRMFHSVHGSKDRYEVQLVPMSVRISSSVNFLICVAGLKSIVVRPAGCLVLSAGKLLLLDDWLNKFIYLGLAARLVCFLKITLY